MIVYPYFTLVFILIMSQKNSKNFVENHLASLSTIPIIFLCFSTDSKISATFH
ncbi:hypothetical protein JCM6292_3393 [Bacteroides pyogenes JCM 6292]|uniref:Uncharacterized protein n=1 Tax=Bacteroides pyogenes JCM 6292 TaxID=1235809 RepID=W4PAR4_9BACE|nr:hypothetical protein JCM6292_3393 [Bacteroides pyogenes JCM 6292]